MTSDYYYYYYFCLFEQLFLPLLAPQVLGFEVDSINSVQFSNHTGWLSTVGTHCPTVIAVVINMVLFYIWMSGMSSHLSMTSKVTLKSPERIFSQELKEELYLVWKWLHFLSGPIRECLIQRFFRQDNYCSKLLNFDWFKPTWDTWLSGKWTQESYLILFKFHIKTEDEKTKLNGFILCCYEMLPEGGCKNICASLCEG